MLGFLFSEERQAKQLKKELKKKNNATNKHKRFHSNITKKPTRKTGHPKELEEHKNHA